MYKVAIFFALVAIQACHTGTKTTNSASHDQNNQEKTIYVAAYKKDGVGMGSTSCYLIKNHQVSSWTMFCDSIVGFDYQPGYEYELIVDIKEKTNVPANAPRYSYTLVQMVNKYTPAGLKSGLYDIWGLMKINDRRIQLNDLPQTPMIEINTLDHSIRGSTGCNTFSSTFEFDETQHFFSIKFPVAQTKRGCPDTGIESEFLEALKQVDSYQKRGLDLFLISTGKTVLTFRKMD